MQPTIVKYKRGSATRILYYKGLRVAGIKNLFPDGWRVLVDTLNNISDHSRNVTPRMCDLIHTVLNVPTPADAQLLALVLIFGYSVFKLWTI